MLKAAKVLKALGEGHTVKVGNTVFKMKDQMIFSAMKHHLNDSPTGKLHISESHMGINDFIRKCESEVIKVK